MRKYGLLGYPLGHSVSDYIHNRIFALCGLTDCEYSLYEVKPDELSLKGDCIRKLDGLNVTIPYKTEIIPFLDRLDESASRYGAVNCVEFCEKSSEYVGYNTDGYGFLESIEILGADLNSKVLLLGCGGAGRMMAFESVRAGAELTLAIRRNPRDEKKAATLSREINAMRDKSSAKMRINYIDNLNITNSYDLLLNATPCGMHPNVDEMPIFPELLCKVKYLFDAVYNPSPTKLIVEADKRGVKTLGGLPMLVYQAVMAEKIWNNIQISVKDIISITEELSEELKERI